MSEDDLTLPPEALEYLQQFVDLLKREITPDQFVNFLENCARLAKAGEEPVT